MKVSLIIIFIALLTIAPCIYLGVKYFDGKITESPYETGLEYDKSEKIIKDAGLALENIKAQKNGDKVFIEFAVANAGGVQLVPERFTVGRPASNQEQTELAPQTDANGLYKAEFSTSGYGNYVLELRAKVASDEVALRKNFYINQ
ncbi:FixH family protein [Seleniivibrio woodruffii]|uniref:FixH family protein n=1 Tax=Seleniivibrio woodruffii TaxID=1078050 RepID=UPI002409A022|nr:FixH family protein [Seleniivibrio woodruffii]